MAKVLLIEPSTKYSFDERWVRPPLGLLYIASMLEKFNHEVTVIPQPLLHLGIDDIVEIVKHQKPDIIGFSCLTANYQNGVKITNILKSQFHNLLIIFGGMHPTYMANEILKRQSSIDFIVRREGEVTTVDLLNALDKGLSVENIAGLSFRKGKNVYHAEDQSFVNDIDMFPYPARHLLPMEKYRAMNPEGHILAARGCEGKCGFCNLSNFFGFMLRVRSPQDIVSEIEVMVNRYGFHRIKFEHCILTFNKSWVFEICDEIISHNLGISWRAQTRLDRLDRQILEKMAEAGCKEILIGLESATSRITNKVYRKGIKVNHIFEVLKWARNVGISITPSFIIGSPDESFEEAMKTIRLAKKLYEKSRRNPRISFLTPFPGTRIHQEIEDKCKTILKVKNYDKFTQHIPILETSKMSIKESARLWAIVCRDIVFSDDEKLGFYIETPKGHYSPPRIEEYKLKEFELQMNRSMS